MIYRAEGRRSATRRPRSLLLWLFCLTILLAVLDRQGLLAPVIGPASRALAPVQQGLGSARRAISDTFGNLTGSSDLQRENQQLKEELSRLRTENMAQQSALAENIELRRTAGMRERQGWRTTVANVIGRSPDSSTRVLTIDRGRRDGLAPGMPVVAHVAGSPDALIGLVDSLTDYTASILLITDARSNISGQILHRESDNQVSQPNGEVIGQWQLGSRLVMRKLDREAKIAPGDPVLTAGISRALLLDAPAARIPPNIPIGTVSAIRPSGHAQEADVQPYFDPDEVRTVWIIVGVD